MASGLPKRNGDNHGGEIASMSLHLLEALRTFEIPHKPREMLKLRIGIHTGMSNVYSCKQLRIARNWNIIYANHILRFVCS